MVISIIAPKMRNDTNQYKLLNELGNTKDQIKLNTEMRSAPKNNPKATSPKKDKSFFAVKPIKARRPNTRHVIPKEIAMTGIGTNIVKEEMRTPITIAYKTNGMSILPFPLKQTILIQMINGKYIINETTRRIK